MPAHRDIQVRAGALDPWAVVPITETADRGPSLITNQTLGVIANGDAYLKLPSSPHRPGREPVRRRHRGTKWQLHNDAEGGRLLPELRRERSPGPTHFYDQFENDRRVDPAGLVHARRAAASLDADAMELTCRIRGPHVMRLARLGNNQRLEKMIRYKEATVNVTDRTGATAVIAAARRGQRDTLRLLLEHGAKDLLESRTDAGWTAVLEACRYGHVPCLQLLLRNGARVDHLSDSGCNGLMLACASGHGDTVHTVLCHAAHADSLTASETRAYVAFSRAAELANEVTKLAATVTRMKREWVPVRAHAIESLLENTEAEQRHAEARLAVRRAEKLDRAARNAWTRGNQLSGANLFANILSGNDVAAEQRRLLKAVLHGWRMPRLHRLSEETGVLAEAAKVKSVAASAANDEYRSKVGELLYPQLQQKKASLRKRWAETRNDVDRHITVLRIGCDMLEASDLDGWSALHTAASQGHEPLVRALLAAGSDPLAVTSSGMRVGALAQKGRFFELRNLLERVAQKTAAYQGIELEELDNAEQAEVEADLERGKLLPSLDGEGRRKILKRRREDAESRRKASGMAQKGKTKKGRNTRLKMGVSSGVGGTLNDSMTSPL